MKPEVVTLIREAWRRADLWRVGRFVILPDHIHLFCAPATLPPRPLSQWIDFWRSFVARGWAWARTGPLWQRDYWDTQLRTGESYDRKWEYVRNNPVRHGLVTSADDWPFQGEIEVLSWHD